MIRINSEQQIIILHDIIVLKTLEKPTYSNTKTVQ